MENTNIEKNTPRDVFLHLLNIFTFYAAVISFITLYIEYINVLFPDVLNFYYTAISMSILTSASTLAIAVPVFLLTSWLLARNYNREYADRDSRLRKWLIYFTLLISSITIIIDLITLVFHFFNGELTTRFFLKVFVVLLVAAAVFGYYIWELIRKNMKSKIPNLLAWIVSFIAVVSIILGFFIIGSPATQRKIRFDEQRIENLQTLQDQIINYWIQKQVLPPQLSGLEDSISGFIVPVDPETKLPYDYKTIDSFSFELCATFKTSSDDVGIISNKEKSSSRYGLFKQNWDHKAERACFTRTIDPQLYKSEKMIEKFPVAQ